MAFGRKQSPPHESERGLKEELISLSNGIKGYLGARSELFSIEAREAATKLGRKAGLGTLALFLLFFGYLLLLAALVGLLGQLLSPDDPVNLKSWVGGAFILAGLHLFPASLFLYRQKKTNLGEGLFEVTRAELKKDQEWLNNEKQS